MSTGKEAVRVLNITVSSGTGTGAVSSQWDLARWVRVIPNAESTTFDVTFKDGDGDIIGKYTSQTGTFSMLMNVSLGIVKTVLIENSTADGTFKVKFDLH
jgi:hypothetical protein